MSLHFNSIALTGNWRDPRVVESVETLADHLSVLGCDLSVGNGYPGHGLAAAVQRRDEAKLPEFADLVIAIGGDGTLLVSARRAAVAGVPVLGINRGRLGFLADVNPHTMLDAIAPILRGDYVSEPRMLLSTDIVTESGDITSGLALNDVVVKRADSGRMFEFETHVDGGYVNTHAGDGFIVATPTGSTAYALSCGGPIVTPSLNALVLAPICPHTLSDRPIVISGSSLTEIRLREDGGDVAAVSCDGEFIGELASGDRLRVAAADRRVELIHPSGYDYYDILRGKLHWGRGSRHQASD